MDFSVENLGNIVLLTPLTEGARKWVAQRLPEDRQTPGRVAIVVEPRHLPDCLDGIEGDGLEVL
jgi:hypothetical protein